jgi:hypothetical protein
MLQSLAFLAVGILSLWEFWEGWISYQGEDLTSSPETPALPIARISAVIFMADVIFEVFRLSREGANLIDNPERFAVSLLLGFPAVSFFGARLANFLWTLFLCWEWKRSGNWNG